MTAAGLACTRLGQPLDDRGILAARRLGAAAQGNAQQGNGQQAGRGQPTAQIDLLRRPGATGHAEVAVDGPRQDLDVGAPPRWPAAGAGWPGYSATALAARRAAGAAAAGAAGSADGGGSMKSLHSMAVRPAAAAPAGWSSSDQRPA
ncbi:MAG: hypothetical protein V9H69_20575 [Anaerolineae bacterium]